MTAQNHTRRPNISTTENYLRNYNPPTVPGNSSDGTVFKFGKKMFVVGDSNAKRIKVLTLIKNYAVVKAFFVFRSFSGANSKQLDYYIVPNLEDDKPDFVLLHVGTNNTQ